MAVLTISVCLELPAWPQRDLRQIQDEYAAADAELHKHLQFDQWLDGEPGTPALLARDWTLAREWVTAWMDAHPADGMSGAKTAFEIIAPSEPAQILVLTENSVLVTVPGVIGNVFLVSRENGRHRVAWSIDQAGDQPAKFARALEKWRAGPAGTFDGAKRASVEGPTGPLVPMLGLLPEDRQGRARFYIDAAYAQAAGGSGTKQISVWVWDGQAARPLIIHDYRVTWFQSKFTRLEGDLLKVHEKRQFRMFYVCAGCEERQIEWVVRVTPDGLEDLGETSSTPQMDAVDELFYRLTRGESAAAVATPAAIAAATSILQEARDSNPGEDLREAHSLGMIISQSGEWSGARGVICLGASGIGLNAFGLKHEGDGWIVASIAKGEEACPAGPAPKPYHLPSQLLK
ncbi:hypothetical protein [Paludibaculum fermentans]|uniref:Uncharacterized protein n=1 Tax=Paludibaculum fermentans TaxID=1473598 RepID=A0A7S7NSU9_PALFE|nr:hypothetical protein [Paludibaculum fermentans]QOY89206.1 hypothetical protein IRI77_04390 [Paludibaculum fermentans]